MGVTNQEQRAKQDEDDVAEMSPKRQSSIFQDIAPSYESYWVSSRVPDYPAGVAELAAGDARDPVPESHAFGTGTKLGGLLSSLLHLCKSSD